MLLDEDVLFAIRNNDTLFNEYIRLFNAALSAEKEHMDALERFHSDFMELTRKHDEAFIKLQFEEYKSFNETSRLSRTTKRDLDIFIRNIRNNYQ